MYTTIELLEPLTNSIVLITIAIVLFLISVAFIHYTNRPRLSELGFWLGAFVYGTVWAIGIFYLINIFETQI